MVSWAPDDTLWFSKTTEIIVRNTGIEKEKSGNLDSERLKRCIS